MKKLYKDIPFEIFLSELYINLRDYYHPEHNKQPAFRFSMEDLNYIIRFIEDTSNNKIKIDKDTSLLKNYNIDISSSQLMLYKPLVSEMLYPPYFHPLWKNFIKDGILKYLFNNKSCIVEYFSKSDIKIIKEYQSAKMNEINKGPLEEKVKKENNFLKFLKRLFHRK